MLGYLSEEMICSKNQRVKRKISFGAKYGIVISRSPSAWAPVISYEFLFCLHDHRLYWKICPDICLWTCINVIILVTQSSQFSSSYCLGNWSLPGTDHVPRLGGSSSTWVRALSEADVTKTRPGPPEKTGGWICWTSGITLTCIT